MGANRDGGTYHFPGNAAARLEVALQPDTLAFPGAIREFRV